MGVLGRALAGALLCGVAAPLAWAQGVPTGTSVARTTMQQDFDTATSLTEQGQFAAALSAWTALEQRAARSPRTLAVARVRKSSVLLGLNRLDEAAAAARQGLTALPAGDTNLDGDRFLGLTTLALIELSALDYGAAADHLGAAIPLAVSPRDRVVVRADRIEALTFVDPQAALAEVPELKALLERETLDAKLAARGYIVLSQLYLNLKDFGRARVTGKEAVQKLGGLTLNATPLDVSARSNVGLASLQLKDDYEARRYLAYTGAGRTGDEQFTSGMEMVPPPCGIDGLEPEDVAVVEVSVGPDGSVTRAVPIYGSRPGPMALAFARAARDWSWTPEGLKGLPIFYRTRVRLEMRCSRDNGRPSLTQVFDDELGRWLQTKGVELADTAPGSAVARLPAERAAVDRLPGDGTRLADVPILFTLISNPMLPYDERTAPLTRIRTILAANGAPPLVRLGTDTALWSLDALEGRWSESYVRRLVAAMGEAPYGNDPSARAMLSLIIADASERSNTDYAIRLLKDVVADPGLPPDDRFKIGAQIRLAVLQRSVGNLAAAQDAFRQSGMTAEQCSLFDAPPRLAKSNVSSRLFPMEAQAWGFEGWTRVEHDIDGIGKVIGVRPVVSYPPFVFSPAAIKVAEAFRYEPISQATGQVGCTGSVKTVNFRLP